MTPTATGMVPRTRSLRNRLRAGEPLTAEERAAVEALVLDAAAAVDCANAQGCRTVNVTLIAERLDTLVQAGAES